VLKFKSVFAYIVSCHKFWYMLLGTQFVLFQFFFRVSRVLSGASRVWFFLLLLLVSLWQICVVSSV